MKIGILVYSFSGHTLAVAQALQAALAEAGHTVGLVQIEPALPVQLGQTRVPLRTTPSIFGYDALLFGTCVRGGAMAAPMAGFLAQMASLDGLPVACLVTGFFPPNLGRNQTLAQMKAACAVKGARVLGAGSVGWFSLRRRRQIAEVVAHLSGLFPAE
jgi:multimeric flavodoxin WrbA